MSFKIAGAVVVATWALAMPAHAGTVYSFSHIPGTSAANGAAGESQLFVEVSAFSETLDLSDGTLGAATSGVSFRFFNVGSDPMAITQIYFEDGAILDLVAIADDDDNSSLWSGFGQVDYTKETTTGNLPGGNTIGFTELAGFHADPDSPTSQNGVDAGEEVIIFWTLQSGQTLADINNFLLSGGLRIGIHVQAFGDGGSESFVNCPDCNTTIIPLPSAAGMGLLGMGGLMMTRRRRA